MRGSVPCRDGSAGTRPVCCVRNFRCRGKERCGYFSCQEKRSGKKLFGGFPGDRHGRRKRYEFGRRWRWRTGAANVTRCTRTFTAILGEIGKQCVHFGKARGVDHETALLARIDQARMDEFFKM